ncbi:hypothetical protein SAMN05444413_10835 [Roseivivax marinus]|uniref:hypothetical protein n=1 Tax=Roseivivax marinus TaxID=1379903 RepID=UPI0008C2BD3F|nr:hypothetical protein [Roseivivax marinus]SEL34409.1 hypothetical protein SAMN05444413_10835 [Roseivivax marinus]
MTGHAAALAHVDPAAHASAILSLDGNRLLKSDHLCRLLHAALADCGIKADVTPTLNGARATTNDGLTARLEIGVLRGRSELTAVVESEDVEADALRARLAGLIWHLLPRVPATEVLWDESGVAIPRAAFIAALSDEMTATRATITPRRTVRSAEEGPRTVRPRPGSRRRAGILPPAAATRRRPAANSDVPAHRHRFDAHVHAYDAELRRVMTLQLTNEELEAERIAQNAPIPMEARLATWAVSLSVATVSLPIAAPVLILNVVRGEDFRLASLAMGLAGFFTMLDVSGAMAALPF